MNHQRNKNLRRIGREKMSGNYSTAIGAFLVLTIISLAASLLATYICDSISLLLSVLLQTRETVIFQIVSGFLNFLVSLILCIFSVGSVKLYLSILAGEKPSISTLFWGFRNHPDKILIASLPLTIISTILSIPSSILLSMPLEDMAEKSSYILILLGLTILASLILILVSLPLYLINYLLADETELSPKEVITTSIRMMKGNCWRLFCMLLSFIGWILLASLSCGIGMFWITPYMETSLGAFYKELKGTLYQNPDGVAGVSDEINYENTSENL